MHKEKKLIGNLGLRLATAGVSCLLLTSPVVAQSDSTDQDKQLNQNKSHEMEQAARSEFMQLDENNDQKLQWDELKMRLETPELKEKWDQDRLMREFDRNDDGALDPQEYKRFLTEVIHDRNQAAQTAQAHVGQDDESAQQREVEIESADVNVERQEQEREQQEPQQQQEQEQQGSQRAQRQSTLDSMSIDELEGRKVVSSDGNELGEVDQVVVSGDQRRAGVVLLMGGILGIGARQVMAPLDQLSLEDDQLVWETSMTKDEIKQSSSYEEQNYNSVSSDNYQNVGELRQGTSQ